MNLKFNSEKEREAWNVVKAINDAWVSDQAEKIGVHLHPDCVMAAPDFDQYLRGKEAVLNSYIEYTKMAKTKVFGITNASVDVFGAMAVVNATFVVTYELNDKSFQGAGREIWVLTFTNDRWYGIWRSLADLYEEAVE